MPTLGFVVMSEQLSRAVATELRRLLEERGMSGNALAKATGISQSSVSNKLAGRHAFDLDDLQSICRVLDVNVTDLLTWAQKS